METKDLLAQLDAMEDEYFYDPDNEESIENEQTCESLYETPGEAYAGGYNAALRDVKELLKEKE